MNNNAVDRSIDRLNKHRGKDAALVVVVIDRRDGSQHSETYANKEELGRAALLLGHVVYGHGNLRTQRFQEFPEETP